MWRLWALILALGLFLLPASAHDVGLSTAEVRCGDEHIAVEIVIAARDLNTIFELDTNQDGAVLPTELAASEEAIGRYIPQACSLQANGQTRQPGFRGASIAETNAIRLSLAFPAQAVTDGRIRFDLVTDMAAGHRMLVSVMDAAGNRIGEELLTQNSPEISFKIGAPTEGSAGGQLPSFFGFIKMGVEHIGTGYDHLLFLFALLLVTRNFRSAVVVISFFTLAHSVTLAGATFNLVQLPSRITEPLIAATIVYVGLENVLRKGDPHGRWALTFCFGLVHGFGFASVLREMGVSGRAGGVAMPLLGFNLGVELGQLAIAALVLPLIWKLRAKPWFVSRAVPACSAAVVLLGTYWLIQRF